MTHAVTSNSATAPALTAAPVEEMIIGVSTPVRVDAVLPVYNEQQVLRQSVERLRSFLLERLQPHRCMIVIADNASSDNTLAVAQQLAQEYPEQVSWLHLDEKGRGRALRQAWLSSDADVLSYMDVDLSSDLASYPLLVQSIINGYDIAIGSRLLAEACTNRSLKREVISRGYNLLIKLSQGTDISDAQCGFKAISRSAAQKLLPLVQNQEWFFDTELLLIANKLGYTIKELPVTWVEDPDSRVKILQTAWEDIKGLVRVRLHPPN